MKSTIPHDPLDDLIAAALHGEMTPEERTQFDSRLRNEPATQAAYQKAQLMHDLLEKTHKNAQPDSSFEQRMVSGVRRKLKQDEHQETAWESLLVLWTSVKRFMPRRHLTQYGIALAFISVVSLSVLMSMSNQAKGVFSTISTQLAYASPGDSEARTVYGRRESGLSVGINPAYVESGKDAEARWDNNTYTGGMTVRGGAGTLTLSNGQAMSSANANLPMDEGQKNMQDLKKVIDDQGINYTETAQKGITLSGYVDTRYTEQFAGGGQYAYAGASAAPTTPAPPPPVVAESPDQAKPAPIVGGFAPASTHTNRASSWDPNWQKDGRAVASNAPTAKDAEAMDELQEKVGDKAKAPVSTFWAPAVTTQNGQHATTDVVLESKLVASAAVPVGVPVAAAPAAVDAAPAIDTRKLIRNAQLDLEVKSYQTAVDQITDLTKQAGGYVDTSNSQKGGNGKLQGTVVVKVLPQYLDAYLIKLRDLGLLRNQSVSTDDVTKDYFDTQARLENSRRMEAQLQDLLKRTNGKVSDLLQVERELGRVRGEIEQMQGQLKLYDFQVQYATVTMNMRETDLNQAAAYLLKENDDFSLFATDVEGTFQQMRKAADDFKGHVLNANLNHNSGSDVSATLVISVPPDQIEAFLAQLRTLGRVDNFTRQTERVAKDGGDTDQPADQTLTEKDKVTVNITIRSDDESRKQVAMTVVTATVDEALDQAKTTALSNAGEILSSSLNKTPQGQSTGQLSIRVPGKNYHALLDAYRNLGRTASFSLQRDDNSGPGVNGDDEPVIVSLSLTDEEAPLQQTAMSVLATDVDAQAQQLKKDAAAYGVQIKASSFEREPNGMEMALMTFRMPMSKYASFVESLKKLGNVESLTVARVDRPDQTRTDDTAPAEISLRLHNQGDIVATNDGFMAMLRQTFGEGAGALFTSIRTIGVIIAFIVPWALAIGLIAWIGRRIYIWKKK